MKAGKPLDFRTIREHVRSALTGPQLLALFPAVLLGAYWLGGERALVISALLVPALFAIAGLYSGTGPAWRRPRDRETDLRMREAAEKAISEILANEQITGLTTAAIAIEIDEFEQIEAQYGKSASARLMKQIADRLVYSLRETDHVVRLEGPRFAVALAAVRRADLESMIRLATRLQNAIGEPYSLDSTRVYVSASIGFCLPGRAPARSGKALMDCALEALDTARANGPGSIRAYCPKAKARKHARSELQGEVAAALEEGQIIPWFQPQVSTATGEITGFESLARWDHPERGLIPPQDFLPTISDMGLQERLCQLMVAQSLRALRAWDKAGAGIPAVGVNFSGEELSNPKLVEWLKWDLDRYEISPERLNVEILENVIAETEDDVVIENIKALSELGCRIDLDDFGTGHASIASIRRFHVNRIKIDRSFVTHVDTDREQQNMVSAILTMAERLGIDTLAEGVELVSEHKLLAELGCGHVQGFSIARPMPFEDTLEWIGKYRAQRARARGDHGAQEGGAAKSDRKAG